MHMISLYLSLTFTFLFFILVTRVMLIARTKVNAKSLFTIKRLMLKFGMRGIHSPVERVDVRAPHHTMHAPLPSTHHIVLLHLMIGRVLQCVHPVVDHTIPVVAVDPSLWNPSQ